MACVRLFSNDFLQPEFSSDANEPHSKFTAPLYGDPLGSGYSMEELEKEVATSFRLAVVVTEPGAC